MKTSSAVALCPFFLGCLFCSLVFNASGERNTISRTCRCSPIDFIPNMVQGRATLSLPPSLSELSLSVTMAYTDRDGIQVLKLIPVIGDKGKCSEYPGGSRVLCYQYSEIHWGSNSEEGSDHSINGLSYPMEMQHYFHLTDYSVILTEVAVGVLFTEMESLSLNESSTFDDLRHHGSMEDHKLYSDYMKNRTTLSLYLTYLLPNDFENSAYYQYREVCEDCLRGREWLVYEKPLSVVESFLKFLRTISKEGDVNHLSGSQRGECVLYSNFVSENEDYSGKCGHIDPMPRLNPPPESTAEKTEDVQDTRTEVTSVTVTETTVDSESMVPMEGTDATTNLPISTDISRLTQTYIEEGGEQTTEDVSQDRDFTVGSQPSRPVVPSEEDVTMFSVQSGETTDSLTSEITDSLTVSEMHDKNRPLPYGGEKVELVTAPSVDQEYNSSPRSKFEFLLVVLGLGFQFYLWRFSLMLGI